MGGGAPAGEWGGGGRVVREAVPGEGRFTVSAGVVLRLLADNQPAAYGNFTIFYGRLKLV